MPRADDATAPVCFRLAEAAPIAAPPFRLGAAPAEALAEPVQVWAFVAPEAGYVQTKEGKTQYRAGDYLVFNDEQGGDGYAVAADKFESMYERSE